MYEKKREALISVEDFKIRLLKNAFLCFLFLFLWLMLGTLIYYFFCGVPSFPIAFLNASMIASGMGPVSVINENDCLLCIFSASFYAIFSGIFFIGGIGFLISPLIHRFYHRFHINDAEA